MSLFATKRAGPEDLRPGERALRKFWYVSVATCCRGNIWENSKGKSNEAHN